MARIYYGRREMLNGAVLEAVRTLDDDFWVLAEFDLDRRNIDWLVIRAVPDGCPEGRCSTLFLTELKQTSAQLSGGEHGRWTADRNGVVKVIVPNNRADENHWQQATNVAGLVQGWLYVNQRRFLSLHRPEYPENLFRLWPMLLVLSNPPEMQHRLPLMPANRYGALHFRLNTWLDALKCRETTPGIQLTAEELARLVAAIGLQELPQSSMPPLQPRETLEVVTGDLAWLQGFARWAAGIEDRLSRLEDRQQVQLSAERAVLGLSERLKHLEGELGEVPARPTPDTTRPVRPVEEPNAPATGPEVKDTRAGAIATRQGYTPSVRPLDAAEKECIVTAIANLRRTTKSRTMSSLFLEMNRLLGGATLKQRKYNGYGSARAMLDQATLEKIIRYGPVDVTGAPTIYLYSEAVSK